MTTTQTAVRRSPLTPATTAIFAALGLADIVLLAAVGSADAPPLAVSIMFAAFGVITLAALLPASRGSRAALVTIIVVRVISAALEVPGFFLSAPPWVMFIEVFVIVATIAALVLLRQQRRRLA